MLKVTFTNVSGVNNFKLSMGKKEFHKVFFSLDKPTALQILMQNNITQYFAEQCYDLVQNLQPNVNTPNKLKDFGHNWMFVLNINKTHVTISRLS